MNCALVSCSEPIVKATQTPHCLWEGSWSWGPCSAIVPRRESCAQAGFPHERVPAPGPPAAHALLGPCPAGRAPATPRQTCVQALLCCQPSTLPQQAPPSGSLPLWSWSWEDRVHLCSCMVLPLQVSCVVRLPMPTSPCCGLIETVFLP